MSSTIAKVVLAALAAGAAAYPQSTPGTTLMTSYAPSSTAAAPAPVDTALIEQLKDVPKAIDRFKLLLTQDGAGKELLPQDQLQKKLVFDFNGANANGGKGGALKSAQLDTFPILTNLGISTTVGFLGPCGLNTPHTHPRATEFLTLVDGDKLDFGFIPENGLVSAGKNSEAASTLSKFQGTVFPIGSIHYQFNPTCHNATFVASLTSEDPGTSQLAQNFFSLNGDIVEATLGFPESIDGKSIEQFRNMIPANVALGIEQCLQTCGISKN